MKIKVNLTYVGKNEIGFNQIIFEKLRGSVWYDKSNFTSFEIYEICNENNYILPDTNEDVFLNILDSSVAVSLKVGDTLYWGVPYKVIGEIFILEIVEPYKNSFFG
jgi:hypothetical protein